MLRTADRPKRKWYEDVVDADKRRCIREKEMVEIRSCKREADLKGLKISQSFPSARHARKQLKGFSSLVGGVMSNDDNLQLNATIQFCELLSKERKHPINGVIQLGVVSRFVEFLLKEDFPQLQCEAAWALANIVSETSKATKKFILNINRALPIFVNLLSSRNADVRKQAVFNLGIVAGHSPTFRDRALGLRALVPLLKQLKEDSDLSMLRNATWALSKFCGGIPQPSFKQVKAALKIMKRLLDSGDEEVMSDTCLALSFLLNGTFDQIEKVNEEVITAGVCPRLVELLDHHSSAVMVSALQAIAHITASVEDSQTQVIIDHGALRYLLRLLSCSHDDKSIKKIACFIISNITAGNKDQIQAVINAGLIGPLVQLLQAAEFDIRVNAVLAISNVAHCGSYQQIECLVSEVCCIKALCDLLVSPDIRIVYPVLDALYNIMRKEEKSRAVKFIREAVDIKIIERLGDHHESKQIAQSAVNVECLLQLHEEEMNASVSRKI